MKLKTLLLVSSLSMFSLSALAATNPPTPANIIPGVASRDMAVADDSIVGTTDQIASKNFTFDTVLSINKHNKTAYVVSPAGIVAWSAAAAEWISPHADVKKAKTQVRTPDDHIYNALVVVAANVAVTPDQIKIYHQMLAKNKQLKNYLRIVKQTDGSMMMEFNPEGFH